MLAVFSSETCGSRAPFVNVQTAATPFGPPSGTMNDPVLPVPEARTLPELRSTQVQLESYLGLPVPVPVSVTVICWPESTRMGPASCGWTPEAVPAVVAVLPLVMPSPEIVIVTWSEAV